MHKKILAVVFCSLLLSTLAHEYVHHRLNRQLEHARHHNVAQDRADGNTTIPDETTSPAPIEPSTTSLASLEGNTTTTAIAPSGPRNSSGDVILIVNATLRIVTALNTSANLAVSVDVSVNLVAVLNLTDGSAAVLNLTDNTGIYISAGKLNITLTKEVLATISLSKLLQIGASVGIAFTASTIPTDAVALIVSVLASVSLKLSATLIATASAALQILLSVAASLSTVITTGISVGFALDAGIIISPRDILELSVFLQKVIIVRSSIVNITIIERYNISINLGKILSSPCPLEIVLIILAGIQASVQLSVAINVPGLDILTILQLVVGLWVGAADVITVVAALIVAIQQPSQANVVLFLEILISFGVAVNTTLNPRLDWNTTLAILTNATTTIHLSVLTALLAGLQSTLLGVNVAAVVAILVNAAGQTVIALIAAILLVIQAKLALDLAVATFVLTLVNLLISGKLAILKKLSGVVSINVSVILNLLLNIGLTLLVPLNVFGWLKNVPVIGDILSLLAAALRANLSLLLASAVAIAILAQIPAIILSNPLGIAPPALTRSHHHHNNRRLGLKHGNNMGNHHLDEKHHLHEKHQFHEEHPLHKKQETHQQLHGKEHFSEKHHNA